MKIEKLAGIARTTNPPATTSGNTTDVAFDDLGRQVMTLYQVRDLVATAFAETSTLAEVTLLANGGTGVFHDMMEITCANQTGAVVTLTVRDVTAGGTIKTLVLPASATQSYSFPIPVPQGSVNNNWTIQNAGSGDISTTVVSVSALFIKNV